MLGASKHCTFCNARSCKMSLFHKDKTLWKKVWEGFRDACVVQISCIEFIKVHVTSTLWTETQTTTEYYKTSFCILNDSWLYWTIAYTGLADPFYFFPHTQYFVQYMSGHRLKPRSAACVERFLQKWDFPVVATMMPRRKGRDLWSPKSTDDVTLNQELFGLHYLSVF